MSVETPLSYLLELIQRGLNKGTATTDSSVRLMGSTGVLYNVAFVGTHDNEFIIAFDDGEEGEEFEEMDPADVEQLA